MLLSVRYVWHAFPDWSFLANFITSLLKAIISSPYLGKRLTIKHFFVV
jgi:hypothetical protein